MENQKDIIENEKDIEENIENDAEEENKGSSLFREILSWIEVLAAAVIIALICNNFIIANSTVPTGSMENTVLHGDRVIGSRLSYTFGEPERGDIAIFKFGWICNRCNKAMGEGSAPATCPNCGNEITHAKTLYYLKRTIGLPGDVVEIKAEGSVSQSELQDLPGLDTSMGADAKLVTAAVYVNGEKLEEDYLKEPMLYTGDMTFEVPEGCYFFLGDNRNSSLDARYWENSYIPKDKVIAKVMFRYFPHPSLLK
ncbi:MAG: signal peptidase I [Eubacteriales bacterium]|nr:signal peptidase I [Eubacteriales bacterium]